jgi:hypothetical protein
MTPTKTDADEKTGPKKRKKVAKKRPRKIKLNPDQDSTDILHGTSQNLIRASFLKRQ